MQTSIKINIIHPRAVAALVIKKGITALIGPSGAGKTTLARIIAGVEDAHNKNTIQVNDSNIALDPPWKRRIGYVPQDSVLFPHLSVAKNVFYGGNHLSKEQMNALDIQHLLGRMPNTLSGGEAKRVAIARALSAQPRLLILDEPTSGLDPKRKQTFLSLIRNLARTIQIPILYITHDVDEMISVADHAALMVGGSIQVTDDLNAVFDNPKTHQALGLSDAGSVLTGTVMKIAHELACVTIGDVPLYIPHSGEKIGDTVRIRIRGKDISLAKAPPQDISILNIIPVTIKAISPINQTEKESTGMNICRYHLQIGASHNTKLYSDITRYSHDRLALTSGQTCYALIKAISVQEIIR